MQMVISSSSVMPPQAAFIRLGVPSSPYVPIISTGIGNIQFLLPKFFFILFLLSSVGTFAEISPEWGGHERLEDIVLV